MDLLHQIQENAQKNQKRIVLPEGAEIRTLKAANIILEKKIAQCILIGEPENILAEAKKNNLVHIEKAVLVNPDQHDKYDTYVDLLMDIRKHKGLSAENARQLVKNPLYLSTLMIKNGDADGEVAGAISATGDVLRPAFQIVKTKPGIKVVSGAFIMVLPNKNFGDNGVMIFADCAVNPAPNENELAEIAMASADTAKSVAKIDPRVAMLSFSTKGSASHEVVDKVINATNIIKQKMPDLKIDGELQADAAIVESIAKRKAPESNIAGKANVLVFPDLSSGNIAYKLVQRMANAEAIGPILQGMAAPINDLSRGCSVEDIVNMVAVTANQAITSVKH